MRFKLVFASLLLIIGLNPSHARSINHNGFLTAGFSQTDNEVSFMGVDDDLNFSDLSLIGIQTTFKPSDGPFQFVAQLLARGNRNWKVNAEWAYIGARLTDNFEFQVGKVRAPMFMISETYDIGITYPWIRPPEELYGFNNIPFTTVNGLKLKFRGSREWFDYDFLIYGGENPEESITATRLDYLIELSMVGLEVNIFIDNLKIRYSYHDAYKTFLDFSASLSDPAFASFAALYPEGIIESQSVFSTFGFRYDDDRMLIIAEAGEREVKQDSTNINWFVTFGYKFGKYVPHVTYSVANITERVASVGIDNEQKSLIIGVKRTLTPATSLKAEVAQSKIDKAGQDPFAVGLYDVFPTSGVTLDDKVNMINLSVNMVF